MESLNEALNEAGITKSRQELRRRVKTANESLNIINQKVNDIDEVISIMNDYDFGTRADVVKLEKGMGDVISAIHSMSRIVSGLK